MKLKKDEVKYITAVAIKLRIAWERQEASINAFSEVAEEAAGALEDVSSRLDEAIGEKSEKWQEGEVGQATNEFLVHVDDLKNALEEEASKDIDEPDCLVELERLLVDHG